MLVGVKVKDTEKAVGGLFKVLLVFVVAIASFMFILGFGVSSLVHWIRT